MKKKPEKFLLFTTDAAFIECVPEAEANTAESILGKYAKHSKKNKYAQYMILCPDGVERSHYEVYKHYLVTHEKQLFEEIPGSKRIYQFDGINSSAVYEGGLTHLEQLDVEWNTDDESYETAEICDGDPEYISLDEIVEQFPDADQLTVIIDSPLHGEIYNYGNRGKKWLRVGFTGGYM